MNSRGDLRASSSKQSTEAARARVPARRRMAVCSVCVGVLDAVVAEWRREDMQDGEAAACVTCGAAAHVWVTPTGEAARDAIAEGQVSQVGRLAD